MEGHGIVGGEKNAGGELAGDFEAVVGEMGVEIMGVDDVRLNFSEEV